jgi:hypothetical protein
MWIGRNRVASSSRSIRRRMCASSTCEPQPSQKAMNSSVDPRPMIEKQETLEGNKKLHL